MSSGVFKGDAIQATASSFGAEDASFSASERDVGCIAKLFPDPTNRVPKAFFVVFNNKRVLIWGPGGRRGTGRVPNGQEMSGGQEGPSNWEVAE